LLPHRKRHPKSHILFSPCPEPTKVNGKGPFTQILNADPKLVTLKSEILHHFRLPSRFNSKDSNKEMTRVLIGDFYCSWKYPSVQGNIRYQAINSDFS